MLAERYGIGLWAASLLAFLASFVQSAFLFAHWALAGAALVLLAVAPARRVPAFAASAAFIGALGLGILGTGFGTKGAGRSGGPDEVAAVATLLAAFAGPIALAVYVALAQRGAARGMAIAALGAVGVALASFPLVTSDALVALLLGAAALLAAGAFATALLRMAAPRAPPT